MGSLAFVAFCTMGLAHPCLNLATSRAQGMMGPRRPYPIPSELNLYDSAFHNADSSLGPEHPYLLCGTVRGLDV